MHENDHQHRLGFKLTISISFGESVFSAGFIQKTIKGDQNVKLNRAYPSRKQFQKVLEDPRRQPTQADLERMPGGAGQPHLLVGRPLAPPIGLRLAMLVLHRLKDCIYIVLSSRFDPRTQD